MSPTPGPHQNPAPGLLRRFVSDRKGRVVVAQAPNLPIAAWAILGLASLLSPDARLQAVLSFLSSAFLFVWAWLELTAGDSPFRRVLGALAIAGMVAWRWIAGA